MNELTGKVAVASFAEDFKFNLEYLDGDEMRYTSLNDASITEVVKIFVCKVADGKFSVNWVEGSGTSVNHVIDVNAEKVWAFITRDNEAAFGKREVFTCEGSFKLIDAEPFTDAQRILAYLQAIFNEKNLAAAEKFWAGKMIQHNPTMPNGLEVLRDFITRADPNLKYEPGKILSNGNIISIHGRYHNWGGKTMIAADYFRLEGGKVVEHWDVMQEDVPAAQSVNGNSMFPIE